MLKRMDGVYLMSRTAVIGEGGKLIYTSGQLLIEVKKHGYVIDTAKADTLTIDPNMIDKDCTIVIRSIEKEEA
jgi:hypothetical protein